MATLITKNSSTASAVPAAGDLVKGELAVNVTDKKVYTKDNSAAVVKLVGSLGNQEANAVAITGGTINGTTIGATTPSTGAFTTASASGGFTGNLTGNVTGNVSGTAANVTGVVAIANGGTGLSALGTGVQSALGQAVTGSGGIVLATSPSLTTPNLGTPSAAVLTNATGLPLTTGVTGTLGVANGGTGITAFGTGVATALGQNVTGSGGIVLATSPSLTTPNLGTPSAATLTNATGLPISTGVSGLGTGVATALGVATGSAGAFVVNGGALGTPSSGTVTNLTGTASININGTVGATTPTTGAFTTLSASGNITVSGGTANGVAYLNGSKALTTGSALTFDGSQLGVGTSSPSAPVDIQANSGGTGIRIRGRVSANAGAIRYFANDNTTQRARVESNDTGLEINSIANLPVYFLVNDTEAMRLTSTGLGIGTSSPAAKLHVQGTYGYFADGTYNGYFGKGNGVVVGGGAADLGISTSTGAIVFGTGGSLTERMRLDSSGNLGIGTSSPQGKVESKTATMFPAVAAYSQKAFVANIPYATSNITSSLLAGYDSAIFGVNVGYAYDGAGYYLAFATNNTTSGTPTERARITSGGELLVGSTSGSWTGNDAKIYSVTSSGWAESLYTTGSAGGASIMRVDNTGAKFIDFRYTSTNVGSITTDGTATAYNTSSDYRLKDNPQPLTGSGAFIDALKPKTWNWTADGSKGVGFIAHEVQEVSPGSVVGTKDAVDEEGKPIMQAMEYGSAEFIANIIAELQSLRARVAQLEAK